VGALELVDQWPVNHAAAAVVRRRADGTEIIDAVGDLAAPFAWASVTKVLVALCVLVACEEETLSLDTDAGPPGSTVRHLLAHASGLSPDTTEAIAPPGTRRIYSNAGYEALAEVLSVASQMTFADYLAGGVLTPLHMTATAIAAGSSPAYGAEGSLADLLAVASELLVPQLIAPSTLADATSVAFAGLAGVLPGYGRFDPCDWGLGFELKDGKAPHWTGSRNSAETFGHFGRSGAFVWVDPVAGLACGVLCDRDFGPWAFEAWPALSDAVIEQWRQPA
jgi:CubicO group peptidase (beta-lactamase class C family)